MPIGLFQVLNKVNTVVYLFQIVLVLSVYLFQIVLVLSVYLFQIVLVLSVAKRQFINLRAKNQEYIFSRTEYGNCKMTNFKV